LSGAAFRSLTAKLLKKEGKDIGQLFFPSLAAPFRTDPLSAVVTQKVTQRFRSDL
jgi:hypothetical protein